MNNFFSHDSNARNSDKIIPLRAKMGAEGYGIYFMILERLREEKSYMSIKDYNMLAFDLRVDAAKVKAVVEDFGLFVFTDDGKYFYSESFLRRMQVKDFKSEKARQSALSRWNKCERNTDAMRTYIQNDANAMQLYIKSDANKEKKRKVIIPPVYIPPLQGGNTHTELSESDKPPEQDNCVTTESPPVAEEKEKSSAKKEKEPVKRFQKPTIEEVKAYIMEKGYDVDAERFWNFYEAKDWFIGKNKMKNWRAAVATWQKKETDYVDIKQKRHDRRRGSEIRATCAEDYSEPL